MSKGKRTYIKTVVSARGARELLNVWLGEAIECELILSRNGVKEVEIIVYYECETAGVKNFKRCIGTWQQIESK